MNMIELLREIGLSSFGLFIGVPLLFAGDQVVADVFTKGLTLGCAAIQADAYSLSNAEPFMPQFEATKFHGDIGCELTKPFRVD